MTISTVIDKLLNHLRKKTYFNYLESNEKWLTKTGLFCLSYMIPIVTFMAILSTVIRAELSISLLWIPVAVCILSVPLRYAAEKMLALVKDTINKATTKLPSSSVLDVITVFIGTAGILILGYSIYSAIQEKNWDVFFNGLFIFITK